jgi:hypothetical protein
MSAWLHNTKDNFIGTVFVPSSSCPFTLKREMQIIVSHPETVKVKRAKLSLSMPEVEVKLHYFIASAPDGAKWALCPGNVTAGTYRIEGSTRDREKKKRLQSMTV